MLPGIADPGQKQYHSSVPTKPERMSGVTDSLSTDYTSKLGQDQDQGHITHHLIRHHKSHVPPREATHKSWTDGVDNDVTWWLKTETETGPGPGVGTGARTGASVGDGAGTNAEQSITGSQSTGWSATTSNITFSSLTLESKSNQTTDWGHSVISTEGYSSHGPIANYSGSSAMYPHHIPSMAEYASTQHIPSQAGVAASYMTAGEHAQHVPTSSLYNVLDVSNSSNASFVYNISLDGIVNDTSGPPWERPKIEITPIEIVIAVILSGFILAIIVGNMFVILSVALFRDMRTLTNGLIVSLASADLLVAIIVLPISLYHEIIGSWTLGPYICDFWITSDVFCCTASILNIVVIAVDRYWLITKNVRYTHNHTFPRQRVVVVMCFIAWVLSGIISSSPLFGWQDGSENVDPYMCIISQDLGYTIFSTFGAFWFPLAVILLVYMKIFKIARRRAKTRARAQAIHPSMNSTVLSEANGKPSRYSRPSKSDSNSPQTSPKMLPRRRVSTSHSKRSHRGRIRSSARTLGLIIGGFVFCWLPFFLLATILPFCAACQVSPYVMSIVLWLGYSNSLLNPAIYAIWDKNFRRSFKRLATCSVRWTHVL